MCVEVRVKESFKKKLPRSMLKWIGHVERMGDEKQATKANTQKVERKTSRRRPKLRWEDCTKRDLKSMGKELGTTYKRNRRLFKENTRKTEGREEEEKDNENENHCQLHP